MAWSSARASSSLGCAGCNSSSDVVGDLQKLLELRSRASQHTSIFLRDLLTPAVQKCGCAPSQTVWQGTGRLRLRVEVAHLQEVQLLRADLGKQLFDFSRVHLRTELAVTCEVAVSPESCVRSGYRQLHHTLYKQISSADLDVEELEGTPHLRRIDSAAFVLVHQRKAPSRGTALLGA